MTLLGPEPWKAFGKSPDEPFCCRIANVECSCEGKTFREHSDEERAAMPALEYVRLESREVGPWRP
jgi:hypothetical protein